jgi:serine/threonine-protein kinase
MNERAHAETGGVPFGRYVIRSRLGRGGMGEVFLADQLGPRGPVRPVALKRMLPQFAQDERSLRLFLDEMAIAAQLNHPNIATTYDFGEIDGAYFLAMEYVEGLTLHAILQNLGPMPVPETVAILRRLSEALAYAHALKVPGREVVPVVHSDVSPHNVMISIQGAVKLLDFGVARAEAAVSKGPQHGKIAYAAPEQMRGGAPDRRFDVWALGVVTYELLIGQRPFRAPTPLEILDLAEKKGYRRLEALRKDAGIVAPIVDRALEPEPGVRFADAGEMAEAFLEIEKRFVTMTGERLASLVSKAGGPGIAKEPIDLTGTGVAVPAPARSGKTPEPHPGPSAMAAHPPAPRPFEDRALAEAPIDDHRTDGANVARPAPRLHRGIIVAAIVAGVLAAFGVFLGLRILGETPETAPLVQIADEKSDPPAAPRDDKPPAQPTEAPHEESAPRPHPTKHTPEKRPVHVERVDRADRKDKRGGLGVLSVRSVPWSRVTLDGASLGDGVVASKPVAAGKHTLTLTPGTNEFPARVVDLEIKVGVVTKVFVDFRANTVRID